VAEPTIRIEGTGIAASCCLQLLQRKGYMAGLPGVPSPRRLAILISQSTQKLLVDIFSVADLFEGLPAVRQRVVAWGSGEPVKFPHSGVVASEQKLLERLRARLGESSIQDEAAGIAPGWTIFTASGSFDRVATSALAEHPQMHFGSRTATVREVELAGSAPTDTCWIESVEDGWLFLLPTGAGRGSLISVSREDRDLLLKSRVIGELLQNTNSSEGDAVAEFPAYPRIAPHLGGENWLACGAAAMAFDPLCGEGAGNAAREAILAAASIKAILSGESTQDVLAEYSLRLQLGFLRHLEACREFYHSQAHTGFWRTELDALAQGLIWTRQQLHAAPKSRFRLVDFHLQRTSAQPPAP